MQNLQKSLIALITIGFLITVPSVFAQMENDSILHERWEHMYIEPGEFTVNDQSDIEVVNFESSRDVRICLERSEHAVPLEVKFRNKTKTIRSGNCIVIEASEIAVSAADDLEEGWVLNGTVEVGS